MKVTSKAFFIISRFSLSITLVALALYFYLLKQNACTEISMKMAKMAKEMEQLREQNLNLQYEIAAFERPDHLLSLAQSKQFAHLKFPSLKEIMTVKEGLAMNTTQQQPSTSQTRKKNILVGAR